MLMSNDEEDWGARLLAGGQVRKTNPTIATKGSANSGPQKVGPIIERSFVRPFDSLRPMKAPRLHIRCGSTGSLCAAMVTETATGK